MDICPLICITKWWTTKQPTNQPTNIAYYIGRCKKGNPLAPLEIWTEAIQPETVQCTGSAAQLIVQLRCLYISHTLINHVKINACTKYQLL
jgi:hypothetical protein